MNSRQLTLAIHIGLFLSSIYAAPQPGLAADGNGTDALGAGVALTATGAGVVATSTALHVGFLEHEDGDLMSLSAPPLFATGIPLLIAGTIVRSTADLVTDDPREARAWALHITARVTVVPSLITGLSFGTVALGSALAMATPGAWHWGYNASWASAAAPALALSMQATATILAIRGERARRQLDGRQLLDVDEPGDLLRMAGFATFIPGIVLMASSAPMLTVYDFGLAPTVLILGGVDIIIGIVLIAAGNAEEARAPKLSRSTAARHPAPQLRALIPNLDPRTETAGASLLFVF